MAINKDKLSCITINTDASFNHQYNIGGYAFYIICDHFKIQKSGKLKGYVKGSKEAEMMCIGNAFAMLLCHLELPKCKIIVLNSDCIPAMHEIKLGKTELGKAVKKIINQVKSKACAGYVKYKHVKAHSGVQDGRSWVNEWCDQEAYKWMRIKLSEVDKLGAKYETK